MVTLAAPVGCFEDWWASARILYGLLPASRGTSVTEILGAPFWIGVFARQPGTGEPHVHLIVGNVSRVQLDSILAGWPMRGRFVKVKPVTHAWGALHYLLSQTRIARKQKGESYARYVNRVKSDHWQKHDALLNAPFHSELDLLEAIMRLRQMQKRTRPKTPESVAQARILAGEHWPIYMHRSGVIHRLPLPLDQSQRKVVKVAILLDTLRPAAVEELAA
jgi:hypothetical protein